MVDIYQIIDALRIRAEYYENISDLSVHTETPIEDTRFLKEARDISNHYRDIIRKIESHIVNI